MNRCAGSCLMLTDDPGLWSPRANPLHYWIWLIMRWLWGPFVSHHLGKACSEWNGVPPCPFPSLCLYLPPLTCVQYTVRLSPAPAQEIVLPHPPDIVTLNKCFNHWIQLCGMMCDQISFSNLNSNSVMSLIHGTEMIIVTPYQGCC